MKNHIAAVIGGGASGLMCALRLQQKNIGSVILFERNDRLGRKLSATGNGQGNISNVTLSENNYFSSDTSAAFAVIRRFGREELLHVLSSLGGLFTADERGRIYPASRQAASVTDLLRFTLRRGETEIRTGEYVGSVRRSGNGFLVATEKGNYFADNVVLACGGMAAPHFGTDGNGYALAKAFGHTVTPLRPSLVQLQTERAPIRGLKGVRADCAVSLVRNGKTAAALRGDVIFVDYGVSGDAIFRLSACYRPKDALSIDFLPDHTEEEITKALHEKAAYDSDLCAEDLFRCIVNSAVGKALLRRCGVAADAKIGDISQSLRSLAGAAKDFVLRVDDTAGFASAQVTKGGIPMQELDGGLMSKKQRGLYIIGEMADVDGECGGYNLQWAFSSGAAAADAIADSVR